MLQRLKHNFLFNNLRDIREILTKQERRSGLLLILMALLVAALDVVGLAAVIPVVMVATDTTLIFSNSILHGLYENLGFGTENSFVIFMALSLLVIFIIKNGISLLFHYLQARYAYNVATNLSRRQYLKFYQMGFQYFKQTNSADVVNDTKNIPTFFASGVVLGTVLLLSELMVMILIIVLISAYNSLMFVALLAIIVPTLLIIYGSTRRKLYQLGQERKELNAEAMARLNQSIFGYVDVKLSNKERFFQDAYLSKQSRLNDNMKIQAVINQIPTRSMEVVAVLGIVMIMLYAFWFAQDQKANLLNFLSVFATASFRMLPSMNRLLGSVMRIKNHQFATEVLLNGALPEEGDFEEGERVPFKSKIEFREISYRYPDSEQNAVDRLILEVKKGEKIGIIGESGSGKTSLMNILLRFLIESEGGIFVDGQQLTEDRTWGWRSIVGYVKQDVYIADASLKENVAFGVEPDEVEEERLWSALEQASLARFARSLPQGVDSPIGEMGGLLSGGQRQRVGIARALYNRSEVLVFDEATSALDMETEKEITESIEKLAESDITLFVIAHRLTTLKGCDRIIELKDGRLQGIYDYPTLARERLFS